MKTCKLNYVRGENNIIELDKYYVFARHDSYVSSSRYFVILSLVVRHLNITLER